MPPPRKKGVLCSFRYVLLHEFFFTLLSLAITRALQLTLHWRNIEFLTNTVLYILAYFNVILDQKHV
jgi:hypothetical protein